jgi:hypothetical protein
MPKLEVDNGFCKDIPGLGKIKPFPKLSPKRVTKCVRETLRGEYGDVEVLVECLAEFKVGIWVGNCGIRGEPHIYKGS